MISSHDERISKLGVKTASVEDRVSRLTISHPTYKLLRNRFISTFKRDKLANATEEDHRRGHLTEDAVTGGRGDFIALEKLYGFYLI
jgi:hypothetical protein